jgi:hypothetical protein
VILCIDIKQTTRVKLRIPTGYKSRLSTSKHNLLDIFKPEIYVSPVTR